MWSNPLPQNRRCHEMATKGLAWQLRDGSGRRRSPFIHDYAQDSHDGCYGHGNWQGDRETESRGRVRRCFLRLSRKRIYVIGGEGFISVFQQADPEHYALIQSVPSTIGVRTGYWFAKRDRFYVGVPAKGNEPAQIWTYEAED